MYTQPHIYRKGAVVNPIYWKCRKSDLFLSLKMEEEGEEEVEEKGK
jgi:hypothetical protein